MKGAEQDLLNMSVDALRKAYDEINSIPCEYAVEHVRVGKADTFGLDSIPEEVIKRVVDGYDPNIVLITEETGKNYRGDQGLEPTQTVLISDPTDRSIKMKEFLEYHMEKDVRSGKKCVHEVFETKLGSWKKRYGNPSISGASGSISAIKAGKIIFNAIVNYTTGDLLIADPLGTRRVPIEEYGKCDIKETDPIIFSSQKRNTQNFVTFLGKRGYPENLEKSNLGLHEENCIDPWTGGPLRILRLSSLEKKDVAFILSNGEKIGEWLGWLAWVKNAKDPSQSDERALEAYRVFFENPRTKELVSVAPGPHYSIFEQCNGETIIDLKSMFQLTDPSHYRETILVAPREEVGPIARVKSLGDHQMRLYL